MKMSVIPLGDNDMGPANATVSCGSHLGGKGHLDFQRKVQPDVIYFSWSKSTDHPEFHLRMRQVDKPWGGLSVLYSWDWRLCFLMPQLLHLRKGLITTRRTETHLPREGKMVHTKLLERILAHGIIMFVITKSPAFYLHIYHPDYVHDYI